jgi:hypothetical protein
MPPGSKAIDSAAFRWSEFNDSSIMVRVGRMVSISDPLPQARRGEGS